MIRVVEGSLADCVVEAVVRAVRADLAPVSTASRELGLRAGTRIEERLQKLEQLPVGGAVMTPAGDLPCDFLIHIVVMAEDEPQTPASVRKALRNGLRRAADLGVTTLALPPLGLSVGLTEPEDEAQALVEVLAEHVDTSEGDVEITIVVSSSYEADLFHGLLAHRARPMEFE